MLESNDIIRAAIRDVPDFPKPGIVFKDIAPILENPVVFRRTTDLFADRWGGERLDRLVALLGRDPQWSTGQVAATG